MPIMYVFRHDRCARWSTDKLTISQPWDTVPQTVSKIFNAQLWQDQRQHQFRMQHSLEQRAQLKNTDYLAPIIADGDMGFGGIPTIIKMTAAFVEAGVAMFHLDDLAVGLKKWTTGEGRTVVPTCEYLDRLRAARLQLDVMGADTLLLARCDLDHAEYLTSVVDPRDHKYVLGATKPVGSFQDAMALSLESGSDMRKTKADWEASAGLMTFDEAVEAQVEAAVNAKYVAGLKEDALSAIPLSRRRQLAREAAGFDIVFGWELPRTSLGQYRIRPDVQAIVDRALAAVPLTDVTWARMDFPIMSDIKEFHESVLKVYPDRLFGFGWGGHYSFSEAAGFPKGSLETLSVDLARDYNIVWQVQPVFAIQGINLQIQTFAEIFRTGGIGAYVEHIQKEALARGIDGVESLEWSGGHLSDAYFDAVNMKDGHDVKGLKTVNGHQ